MSLPESDSIELDLTPYIDQDALVIHLSQACEGILARLSAIQDELRRQERKGWCQIILMTDDLAVIKWHDQFVLTVLDDTLASGAGHV